MAKLAGVLGQAGHWQEAERVWQEAERVIGSISDEGQRGRALIELAGALGQARRWQEAEQVRALIELAGALGQAGRWQEAEQVWHMGSISGEGQRGEAWRNLADALTKHNEHKRLLNLVHQWWLQANTRDEAIKLLPLAFGLIPLHPNIGMAFYDAFAWVDNFLRR